MRIRIRFLCLACLSALAAQTLARAATVWSLDGRTFDGAVRILQTRQVQVTPADGPPVRIDLADLLYATLGTAPETGDHPTQLGPWAVKSMGKIVHPVDAFFTRGFYTFHGAGGDIAGTSDNIHFLCKNFYGNGECVARIIDIKDGEVCAGLMFRAETEPDACHVSLLADAKGALTLRYRAETGKETTRVDAGKVTFPVYLRLIRADRQFYASTSADGRTWENVARVYDEDKASKDNPKDDPKAKPPGVELPPNAAVGLVFAGGSDDHPGTALFDQFNVREQYYAPLMPAPTTAPAQYVGSSSEFLLQGILLHTGTFLAKAAITSVDGARITVRRAARDYTFDLAQVARIQRQNLPAAMVPHLPQGAAGVVLSSGDFMEGDIAHFDRARIDISNVTLGLNTYPLDGKVQAILLRDVAAAPPGFRVRLADGSLLVARTVDADDRGDLAIDEYALGRMTVPRKEVISVQGAADRVVALLPLHPLGVDAPPGCDVSAVHCFAGDGPLWLAAGATPLEQGIVGPAGTAVRFQIPAGSRRFVSRAAVPQRLPEKATVRFIVLADGKEIFRSADLSNRDKSVDLNLPVEQARTLTLRVESKANLDLPTYGLWANPFLIR